MTAMFTTAGLTLSMTSANEVPAFAGVRGAAGCAVRPPLKFNTENVSTPAPTAPASQPKRADFVSTARSSLALLQSVGRWVPR